ncbi:MAG: manganese efflux pump MntP family protein [Thermoguttaceae bacterium]|jgi:putative Mn2+ efflux pump MntP
MDFTLNWLSLLGISLGLAMDAFAVSIAAGLGLARVTPRHTFRVAFHFGLFQFLMPIIGWSAGRQLNIYIHQYDHWVALVLLSLVGCKMLWEAGSQRESNSGADPTRGLMLLTLSLATSIDALAVGVSMALLGVSIWLPSVVIGLITAAMSAVGITFGGRIGARWQRWAETAGGVVLILIGLDIFISHFAG